MDQHGSSTPGHEDADRSVVVSNTVAGVVRGRDVSLTGSAAAAAMAAGDLSLDQAACGAVLANGGVSIRYGGCGPLLANGDVSIEYGGTQAIVALREASLGRGSFVGFVVSPKVRVEAGGRVLFGTRQALVFGAAAGLVLAVLSRRARR
jgi:hypothetical protein